MKRRKIYVTTAISIMLISGLTIYASSDSTPGSVSDPLATKSYVDEKIDKAMSLIGELIEKKNDNNDNDNDNNNNDSNSQSKDQISLTFEPIGPLKAGTIIYGGQGTEIILRSGSATAICPDINGLQNVTKGIDIPRGEQIPLNHLIIVPRKDGRGIRIEEDSYIMVRGEITNE